MSTKNIKIDCSSKKLNNKQINFFEIIESKNNNVKLKLQNSMKIYNNFYILLLQKEVNNLLFEQTILLSFLIIINDKKKFKIDNILNLQIIDKSKKLQYRIK